MKLTVVGCSPAWPNPGGAQSGYLVDDRLLLDCGPGVLGRLRQRHGGWPDVAAVAITHWHLDHWGDLVPWVWGTLAGFGRSERSELWVPPGGKERLAVLGGELGFPEMWDSTFVVREYAEGEPFEATGLRVMPLRLPHYQLRTCGFRVESDAVLAYSGDSGPSPALAELARDADLFVCEATLERGELDGSPRGHLAIDETLAAYDASHAKRLLVTHRPHELDVPAGLELAYDGLELEVASR